MFGYIKPFMPELKIKDDQVYKAVYCGLCGQLGSSFGGLARFTLSYDFTFLCMLHYAVSSFEPEFGQCRCYANPLKQKTVCQSSPPLEFSAQVAAIMIYYKLLDNIQDSGILAKAGWSLLRPFAAGARHKAQIAIPQIDAVAGRYIQHQSQLEQQRCHNVDAACEPTAIAMEEIYATLTHQPEQVRVLRRLGYLMGRYIYLCDALDDLEQDSKQGGYNPFLLRSQAQALSPQSLADIREEAKASLYLTVAEIGKTYDLLQVQRFAGILDNIIYLGLRAGVDRILSQKEEKNERSL